MKVFTILEAPDGKPDKAAFIPEGFAYFAFLLTFVWAFWHRMWVVGLVLFAIAMCLTVAVNLEWLGPGLASLVQFGIAAIFGLEARRLQVISLERAGYRRAGLIQASAMEAAELTYFAGRVPVAPKTGAPSARLRTGPDDTLGIFGNM